MWLVYKINHKALIIKEVKDYKLITKILYEHPLNERIRNYLKLEHLFTQAQDCLQRKISVSHQVFFNALFAIIDTL